jgi:hypothetical protein
LERSEHLERRRLPNSDWRSTSVQAEPWAGTRYVTRTPAEMLHKSFRARMAIQAGAVRCGTRHAIASSRQ